MWLECTEKKLDLTKPVVMGIVNLTPDSFSGDGLFQNIDLALAQSRNMVQEGAVILDLGAESTRPGAQSLTDQQEIDRLMPVLERVLVECDAVVSVDTRKPAVIQAALQAGAHMINSVDALTMPGAVEAVAHSKAAICLMHMRGEPSTMQQGDIVYDDVVEEIKAYLQQRIGTCEQAGIAKARIVVDPGFGFGKTHQHNCMLLKGLRAFTAFDCPVLFGCSRKSTLGHLTGRQVDQRVYAGVAGTMLACYHGATIIRTHDVAATMDAMAVYKAVMR